MKIWLDDIRKPPDESWTWIKDATQAFSIIMLKNKDIEHVSFDHDLGENSPSGYWLAEQLEVWIHADYALLNSEN